MLSLSLVEEHFYSEDIHAGDYGPARLLSKSYDYGRRRTTLDGGVWGGVPRPTRIGFRRDPL